MKHNITIRLRRIDRSKIERIYGGIVAFIEAVISLCESNSYVKNKIQAEIKKNKESKKKNRLLENIKNYHVKNAKKVLREEQLKAFNNKKGA